MADGGVTSSGMIITVSHDLWSSVRSFFSADARVVGMDLPWRPMPQAVDVVVRQFVWPVPSTGVSVAVLEAHPEHFFSELRTAGIELPAAPELPGLNVLDIDDDPTDPGDLVPGLCISCGAAALHIEGVDSQRLMQLYIDEHRLTYRERQGLRALRCATCLDTHLDGTPDGLVRYVLELG